MPTEVCSAFGCVPPFSLVGFSRRDMRRPAHGPLSLSTLLQKAAKRIATVGPPGRRRSVGRDALFVPKEARIPVKMFVNLYSPDNPTFEVAPTIDISCHGVEL